MPALKRVLTGVIIALALTGPVAAGPREDGLAANDRGSGSTALRPWRPAAEQGDEGAQHVLDIAYANGDDVPQDLTVAAKSFRRAAEQGDADAQYNLGLMYDLGEGVLEDDVEAAKWFRRAAEQGDADAQYELGRMYYRGEGVPQDYSLAHMWLNLASAQGSEFAVKGRDIVARRMTPDQIAEARRLAQEWKPKPER